MYEELSPQEADELRVLHQVTELELLIRELPQIEVWAVFDNWAHEIDEHEKKNPTITIDEPPF